ncbi:hypothetical protein QQ054_15920 [Oscillatoria amoena NRMC-F 0135]|nr:hypothetical protein [Oscillatoria amoena NRMC-F 0135]
MKTLLKQFAPAALTLCLALIVTGCGTTGSAPSSASGVTEIGKGMKPTLDPTRAVPVGNEFIGQRFYNEKFMYWGFVRPPQDNWGKTTRLVMMREKVPAPDRAEGPRGRDDGSVYLLKGHFSGEIAYEPKSDLMLDVFVLEGYELISEKNPPLTANMPLWVADRMYYSNSGGRTSRQGTKQGLRLHEDLSMR